LKAEEIRKLSPEELGNVLYSQAEFIYNIAYRILLNKDDAEEATSETIFRAYSKISSFHGASELKTWLYRITVNVCLDFLRKRKPTETWEDAWENIVSDKQNAEDLAFGLLEREEKNEVLKIILDRLKPRSRLIFILREVEGLSYQEIAESLSCRLGTVKSMLSRAKREALLRIEESPELKSFFLRQSREDEDL